jgi:hypothetical protein
MAGKPVAPRLVALPTTMALGREVAVAVGFRARLLGLAFLTREQAGGGLLIPGCSSVHTFGMRFALDLVFLDESGAPLSLRPGVGPRRVAGHRRAAAVIELPSPQGGEFAGLRP